MSSKVTGLLNNKKITLTLVSESASYCKPEIFIGGSSEPRNKTTKNLKLSLFVSVTVSCHLKHIIFNGVE